jgi:hypothetical protein
MEGNPKAGRDAVPFEESRSRVRVSSGSRRHVRRTEVPARRVAYLLDFSAVSETKV